MLPEKMLAWGYTRNCIREVMEYGTIRKAEIGAENVYDYSIGNPSVPAPAGINETIAELIRDEDSISLHGYTTAAGLPSLRNAIAKDLNDRYDFGLDGEKLYVTCGAASSIAISLRAVLFPGDEVLVMAPFFPEYRVFTEASRGEIRIIPPREDFQIDMELLSAALSERTKAVIINSPNNPSGMVYSEETLRELAEILRRHEEKIGETIYLISDEPYRELVYDMDKTPNAMNYYDDSIICYSFSKAMSIPGERIGYVAVSPRMKDCEAVCAAVKGAGRALGYINPPSLFQRVIERCVGQISDISKYRANRDLLTSGLREIGYECVDPKGAFYLFAKALEPDAKAFCEHAKRYELLLVPSNDFGMTGWFRMAYCVDNDMIRRSMPAFRKLMDDYRK
ncbi:MAG: pyridoxal phosphate-dependent aminotransferase [Ruminococcaceae bacterium]|nr:pyridoxal phosphate-dependent aminotransferase [Oscillospiraceae bacterium]